MSDDIVARLRDYHATVLAAPPYYRELTRIAADEIERLRSERDEAIIGANAVIREASALITAKIPSGKASAYWNAVDEFRRTESKTT